MKLRELRKNWNKYTSNLFLHENGLNVLKPILIEDSLDYYRLVSKFNSNQLISVRTFKANKGFDETFSEPFLPHRVFNKTLNNTLMELLDKEYSLLIYPHPLNPQDTITRGNILVDTGFNLMRMNFTIEYLQGPGTVRDLEYSTEVKQIINDSCRVANELGPWGTQLLREVRRVYLSSIEAENLPVIFEWSVYPYDIGYKKEPLILWELRLG